MTLVYSISCYPQDNYIEFVIRLFLIAAGRFPFKRALPVITEHEKPKQL